MNELEIKEIEKIIQKFHNNIELESFLKKEVGIAPCIIMKKNEKSAIFSELHHHDLYEILYIESGSVLYIIEDKQYVLNAGDMILISPTTLHKLDKTLTNSSTRVVLTFSESYARSYNTENSDLLKAFKIANKRKMAKITFESGLKKAIEKYINMMLDLQFSKEYGDDLIYKLRFLQLMIIINKEYLQLTDEKAMFSSNHPLSDTIDYIDKNLDKKITIKDLADRLSLSESRMSHLFKEQADISIIKFINKKRLIRAKELIRKGVNISSIHTLVGFQDNTSFYRAFKKEYGITPKTYLKNYQLSQE